MEWRFLTHGEAETEQLGADLAPTLSPGDVLAYRGGMGAGKTAFTRGLARGLGLPEEEVSSPTFALVNEYRGEDSTLYHFDMYRVEDYDSLYSAGFFDYLDTGAILAIEWSENIAEFLPKETVVVEFSYIEGEEDGREIVITRPQ